MKKILYSTVFLLAVSFTANAQSKIAEMKQKNNLMMHMKQNQNLKGSSERLRLKINPFWQNVDAPHVVNNSHVRQVKIPAFNTIWASVDYDTAAYIANSFLRSADGGKRWRLDSVDAPNGYGLSGLSPIDANTCYAAMFNGFAIGVVSLKLQMEEIPGNKLSQVNFFSENSFPDIVYFFDAQHGVMTTKLTVQGWRFIQPAMPVKSGSVFQNKIYPQHWDMLSALLIF